METERKGFGENFTPDSGYTDYTKILGNQTSMVRVFPVNPYVVQRVPKLGDVALERVENLLKNELNKTNLENLDYYNVLLNQKSRCSKLGLKKNFFGQYKGRKREAKNYFCNLVKNYFNSGNENNILGSQLNADGNDFNEKTKNNAKALKNVLTEVLFHGGTYRFQTPVIAPAAASPPTFEWTVNPTQGTRTTVEQNIEKGFQQANVMMRPHADMHVREVALRIDKTGSKQGGRTAQVGGTDEINYFDRSKLRVPPHTIIPLNTNIPSGTCILKQNSRYDNGSNIVIPKGTEIPNGTEIPLGAKVEKEDDITCGTLPDTIKVSDRALISSELKVITDAAYSPPANLPAGIILQPNIHIENVSIPRTPIKESSKETVVHELAHQFEAGMGAEDMVKLYRGLYARTRKGTTTDYDGSNFPEQGFTHTLTEQNKKYGLNLLNVPLDTEFKRSFRSGRGAMEPEKDNMLKSYNAGYAGTLAECEVTSGPAGKTVRYKDYATEFLSTTAEFLADERSAKILINKDPLRVALFLKFANEAVYGEIKAGFEAETSLFCGCFGTNLDKVLNVN